MCLIIAKPADTIVPITHFIEAVEQNPDGWGVSWRKEDGSLAFLAGWDARDLQDLDKLPPSSPWLFHARFATHGSAPNYQVNYIGDEAKLNRQPFVHSDLGWAMAHNGILSKYAGVAKSYGPSDSRIFATEVAMRGLKLEKFTETGKAAQEARRQFRKLMGKGWNKVGILYAGDRKPFHLEGDGWHCENGVWYSNHSYLPFVSGYGTSGYYSTQWDQPKIEVVTNGDPKGLLLSMMDTEKKNGRLMVEDVEQMVYTDPDGAAALLHAWYTNGSTYIFNSIIEDRL